MGKFFNRGIASGERFCNRTDETTQLLRNIHKLTHTLLISPRRYGKTSLSLRAIENSRLPFAYIDLFMKYGTEDLVDEFYQSIGALISKLMTPTEKTLKKLESMLKNFSVSLKLGKFGFEISIHPKTEKEKKSLKTLLVSLDELLASYNKQAIIFIDEIQTISDVEICGEIESALRFVAQKTNHLIFIFSGSSRHLIQKIFDDRSRPLYKLCQRMTLHRISAEHYIPFINQFSKKNGQHSLSKEVFEKIFDLTELHPYYVNILCSYLFDLKQIPLPEDVDACWEKICLEEEASVAKDIEFLTQKQKSLLAELAKTSHLKEPTGKDFVKKTDLTPRGVLGALKLLLKHDIVERLESGEIRIVDPVLKYWLSAPSPRRTF